MIWWSFEGGVAWTSFGLCGVPEMSALNCSTAAPASGVLHGPAQSLAWKPGKPGPGILSRAEHDSRGCNLISFRPRYSSLGWSNAAHAAHAWSALSSRADSTPNVNKVASPVLSVFFISTLWWARRNVLYAPRYVQCTSFPVFVVPLFSFWLTSVICGVGRVR